MKYPHVQQLSDNSANKRKSCKRLYLLLKEAVQLHLFCICNIEFLHNMQTGQMPTICGEVLC